MLLRNSLGVLRFSDTGLSPSRERFSIRFAYQTPLPHRGPTTPEASSWFGLFRFRSPLLTESFSLSFPLVTEMFHFTRYSAQWTIVFTHWQLGIHPAGLPHSETHGSKRMCRSPWLIAACRVLHRLLAPRHSSCALRSLINLFLRQV